MLSNKITIAATLFATVLILSASVPRAGAQQDQVKVEDFGVRFIVALGGKLYDNVWTATNTKPPAHRNPAFPAVAGIDDAETWRCVSCHGWDYKGIEGERATLGRHAAFVSLNALTDKDPTLIVSKIRNAHPSIPREALPDFVVEVLALFISVGQYDRDSLLDDTNRISGDTEKGRDIFEGVCMNCHEPDGRATLFGEKGDRSSLGWIARNRPEQALHKMLNGVPGADMLAIGFMEPAQIINLFAYVQTLDPGEK